jgi:hypothetical protein
VIGAIGDLTTESERSGVDEVALSAIRERDAPDIDHDGLAVSKASGGIREAARDRKRADEIPTGAVG